MKTAKACGEGAIASVSPLLEGDGQVRCYLLLGHAIAVDLDGYRSVPKGVPLESIRLWPLRYYTLIIAAAWLFLGSLSIHPR